MDKRELEKTWKRFFAKRDKKTKTKLVEHYFSTLVKKIANGLVKKFKGKLTSEELASHGIEGLYRAIDAYSPDRGAKFDTYAYSRIWGSVLDGIREEDRVPRSVRQRQASIENAKTKIESETGNKANEMDAIEEAGFDIKDFNKNHSKFYASSFSSIETSISIDMDGECQKDFNKNLIAKDDNIPGKKIVEKEFFSKLVGKSFTPLERKIVYHYYYDGLSMTELSERFNISESKISQMHKGILSRLKNKIKLNPDYFEEIKSLTSISNV